MNNRSPGISKNCRFSGNRQFIALALLLMLKATLAFAQTDLTQYVNPFIGTGGHGHTFPGAVMPFGMVQLSPDTRLEGWDGCGGYHYSDSIIYGFSHTHLSGTGIPDYCDILMMPTVGEPQLKSFVNGDYKKGYASHFSHKNEIASPGFYAVHLDDDNIDAEFTVTPRVGFHKYVFPATQQANIILDLTHRDKVLDSYVKVIDSRHIEGYRRSQSWAQNQVVYFYAEFSKQMELFGIAENDSLKQNIHEAQGTNVKAYFQFHASKGEAIYIKVAISQTSMEGAQNNMRECMTWDFEAVKRDAAAGWNYELSKIEVSSRNEEQKKIFYSALYHCMIHPSLANDVDGKYLGRDFKVHQLEPGHNYYTVFSLWDTHRALHPLLTIIDQKRTADFINTFLLEYEQGGRLPVWELSSNETECMIGYHSVSVITDAAMKGIKFDYKKALEAMKHSAEMDHFGLAAYKKQGYISMEDEAESVSKTLEYSYDDWCISQMAKLVGDTSTYKEFIERGQYWKNIFDWKRGFMRPKKNGGWYSPFNPFEVNSNYTEANAWQYLFAVPEDISGLIKMMGGLDKFESKLDSLFSVSSQTAGRDQSDITGLIGQYAHGNEPSHHMAYLYDYCGAPWKTQQRVRQIMNDFYHDAPDGLIGNEDCGQMSAWYVMSAMGFYEVTPGYPNYAIGSPIFDLVKIHLENQKTFTVVTTNNSPSNKYIHSIQLPKREVESLVSGRESISMINGQDFSYNFIVNGDSIKMGMSSTAEELSIYSEIGVRIGKGIFIPNPIIQSQSNSFGKEQIIEMQVVNFPTKQKIYFTQDGTEPTIHSKKYSKPLVINSTQTIKTIAVDDYGNQSKVVTASFHKTNKNYKVTYLTNSNSQYTGSGATCLIDEESGTKDFRNGQWQGWWGDDMQLVVDLGKETSISKVGAEFLQNQSPWIFFPKALEVLFSSDGINFHDDVNTVTSLNLLTKSDSVQTVTLQTSVNKIKARYIKIIAHNYGKLPSWHISAGSNAWIFCDEIFVE